MWCTGCACLWPTLPLSQLSRCSLVRPTYEWVVVGFLISKARVWSGKNRGAAP